MQASLLLIARRLGTLSDPRWFRAWAYRITTREAVRVARRHGRERRLIDEDVAVENVDAAAPDPGAAGEFLRRCADRIDRLPPAAQMVVRLHFLEDLTLVEVAEALEIPLGTVKSRLAYGLARLREEVAHSPERPTRDSLDPRPGRDMLQA